MIRRALTLVLAAALLFAGALQAAAISTTPSQPLPVNGNVLALAMVHVNGCTCLVLGGSFTMVGSTPAHNLAVVDVQARRVVFAGDVAVVRALTVTNGRVYVGTDAGGFAMAVSNWQRTSWAGPARKVWAMTSDSARVYYALSSSIIAADRGTGAVLWTDRFTGGPTLTLLSAFDRLYVGGMFETFQTITQHGLVALNPSNGVMDRGFNAHLRPDSEAPVPWGHDDGDCVLSLAADPDRQRLITGTGGATENALRSINPFTGYEFIKWNSEGDVQAVAYVDKHDYFSGNHRSHGNTPGQPWTPWFGMMHDADAAWQESWDPGLTGDNRGFISQDNHGGVNAALVDGGRLYLGGAFTTPISGLAVY